MHRIFSSNVEVDGVQGAQAVIFVVISRLAEHPVLCVIEVGILVGVVFVALVLQWRASESYETF